MVVSLARGCLSHAQSHIDAEARRLYCTLVLWARHHHHMWLKITIRNVTLALQNAQREHCLFVVNSLLYCKYAIRSSVLPNSTGSIFCMLSAMLKSPLNTAKELCNAHAFHLVAYRLLYSLSTFYFVSSAWTPLPNIFLH